MSFALVEEPDATIAKARLSEQQQRAQGEKNFTGMICMHCKKTGNTIDLTKHAKNECVYVVHNLRPFLIIFVVRHKISDVTEKDIARWNRYCGSGESSNIFYLWPPRERIVAEVKETAPTA